MCNLSKRLWIWGTSALFCVCGENVGNGFPKPGILACLTFSPVLRLCLCPVGGLGAGLPSPLQHPELLEKFHSCFGVCPELPPCCAGAVSSTNRFAAAVLGSASSGLLIPALPRHFAPFRCRQPVLATASFWWQELPLQSNPHFLW